MPWNLFHSWYASMRPGAREQAMPLTLITLRGIPGSSDEEVAFYSRAEFDALVDWAMNGRFVMAFVARERDELTLLCTETVAVMETHVSNLPLVAAGLAQADIRMVSMLRLVNPVTSFH